MVTFWILTGLLAVPMLLAGVIKLQKKPADLHEMGMLWTEDYTEPQIRLIGAAEAVGAVGLVAPAATGILPILSPIAAACLGVIMGGAFGVHAKRKDPAPSMIITGTFVALSAYLAYVGFAA